MTERRSPASVRALPIVTALGAVLGAVTAGASATAATIIEVNEETPQVHADCSAAWARLESAYRQGAARACRDAGGVQSITEAKTGKKPVGGKFICTLEGRILCRK